MVSGLFLQEFPFEGLGSAYVAVIVPQPEWEEIPPSLWGGYPNPDDYPDALTLSPSATMTVTFTVELASIAPYGSQLINNVQLTEVPDETSPENNRPTDRDIGAPGFNSSPLPLGTRAYPTTDWLVPSSYCQEAVFPIELE